MRRLVFSLLSVSLFALFVSGCNSLPMPIPEPPPEGKAQPNSSAPRSSTLEKLSEQLQSFETASTASSTDPANPFENTNTFPESPEQPMGATEHFEFWPRVRANYQLDLNATNPRVEAQRNWYLKHPKYLQRVLDRAEPYIFYIFEQIEQRGLPGELLFLPIVESAFDPFAYSHGRASGMWQFIPGTAKMFGLKQTWWYDGRRDVIASTKAALDYLTALAKRFDGNWLLALAAYNSGAGTVSKAIKRNKRAGKPTDFWSLKLPRETRAYVPKLVALAQIFKHPDQYGVALKPIATERQFDIVDVGGQIDMAQAARLAGITLEQLYRYNPGFNRWATDPDGPHYLLIPIDHSADFKAKLAQLPPHERITWVRYTIKKGDSLIKIAKRHNVTPKLLRDINHLHNNRIVAGKTLMIPQAQGSQSEYSLSLKSRLEKIKSRNISGKQKQVYVVKSGDSLWDIARLYKVSHRKLAKWNGMAPNDTLRVGQKLVVWTKGSANQGKVRKISYRARSGDSYARIAQKFNVSLAQLQRWNRIDLNKYLKPGDRLTLYVDITNAP